MRTTVGARVRSLLPMQRSQRDPGYLRQGALRGQASTMQSCSELQPRGTPPHELRRDRTHPSGDGAGPQHPETLGHTGRVPPTPGCLGVLPPNLSTFSRPDPTRGIFRLIEGGSRPTLPDRGAVRVTDAVRTTSGTGSRPQWAERYVAGRHRTVRRRRGGALVPVPCCSC
jgi:hypothetical protein